MEKDTLHIFINHWPSRYSGLLETRPIRDLAAKILRQKIDELNKKFKTPKIIIMGDFNDQPNDESMVKYLHAEQLNDNIEPKTLYNLSYNWLNGRKGTLKFQSQWSVFDQIIVSGALLQPGTGFYTRPENAQIVDKPFLLEKDERNGGMRPFRTYVGFRYQGGFSDHLPVLVQLDSAN